MKTVEEIILWQSDIRGMDVLAEHNDHGPNFCQQAAKAILECERGVIFILTGFYVNGVAETDGPPGAFYMANALKTLGFHPIIISDVYCKHFFKHDKNINTIIVDENSEKEKGYYESLLERHNPVALISIERCGRNESNQYLNMLKKDISKYTAKLDELFLLRKSNVLTIGIGDGGNEIGMGNMKEIINSKLNNSKDELPIIPSIITADFLITATVSNWGAYGVIGYLQILTGKTVMPTFSNIVRYLEFILSKGAVDGVNKKETLSVDGYGLKVIKNIIDQLHIVVDKTQKNICTMNSCYDSVSLSQKKIGCSLSDRLIKHILDNKNKQLSVIDIGCNTGELTNYIYKSINNKDISVTGSDINIESLNAAKKRFPYLNFLKLDIHELEKKHQTYDIVFSNETLHWMPNIPSPLLSEFGCIYYFYNQSKKKAYEEWAIKYFENCLININSLLSNKGVAFLQFGLDKQLFQVWNILNKHLTSFPNIQSVDLTFPIFYPKLNQVIPLLSKYNFRIILKKEKFEPLTEETAKEVVDFIKGFCFNFISLKIGRNNAEKILTSVYRDIQKEGVEKFRESQWHRLTLVIEKNGGE